MLPHNAIDIDDKRDTIPWTIPPPTSYLKYIKGEGWKITMNDEERGSFVIYGHWVNQSPMKKRSLTTLIKNFDKISNSLKKIANGKKWHFLWVLFISQNVQIAKLNDKKIS